MRDFRKTKNFNWEYIKTPVFVTNTISQPEKTGLEDYPIKGLFRSDISSELQWGFYESYR